MEGRSIPPERGNMKFRMDHVTNSSSSSFIFKKIFDNEDVERLRKRFNKNIKNCPYDWLWYAELGSEEFEDVLLNTKPIQEHDDCDIFEVFTWYRKDILDKWSDHAEEPEETLRFLAKIWYLDRLEDQRWRTRHFFTAFSEEQIKAELDEYAEDLWPEEDLIRGRIMHDFSKFSKIAIGLAGITIKELLPTILSADFMYFSGAETSSPTAKVFFDDELCLFGCNHMG